MYPDKLCDKFAMVDKHYCALHKKFEEMYSPDELDTLVWCKKCKQRARPDALDTLRRCKKCIDKQKRDMEKIKAKKQTPCCWLNQKQEPCSWKALPEEDFCKRHMKYKDIFTKEDIPHLKQCSTCKNLFKPTTHKICEACLVRGEKIRKQQRQTHIEKGLCKAIIQSTGKRCDYKPMPNDTYCEKHQSYKKWKEMTDSGQRVCINWIRGCFQVLEVDDKAKCKRCKYLTNNHKLTVDVIKHRITSFKTSAKARGIGWELTNEQCKKLFEMPCFYCNYYDGRTGIDRVDSDEHYCEENIVPCCTLCNQMKLSHSLITFVQLIHYLGNVMNIIPPETQVKTTVFMERNFKKSTHKSTYNQYKYDCGRRDIVLGLTKEEYETLLSQPCYYCKNFPKGANGIDRKNSEEMYTPSNSVPCCATCNYLKLCMSITEFKEKIKNIYYTQILKEPPNYETDTRAKMIALLTANNYKITSFGQLKLYDPVQSYYTHMYSAFTLDDIQRIRVRLLFIEPSTMKKEYTQWKFYKRHISSMNIRIGHRNVGRRVYILVQDETTQTVLGVLSLTSDIKNLQARDTYIGWNKDHQYTQKKLQQLMNISTCVSTQPFGFNTNGGKLLTSLAFSKEVLEYIYKKYNTYIHGITTMSIYGKSVQYDRLPCVRFVGYSSGFTTSYIPQEVIDFARFLEPNIKDTLYLLKKVFQTYDIPLDDFTKGIRKGVYFGYTHPGAKEYLLSNTDTEEMNPIPYAKTVDEITEWWKSRWAIQRFTHLQQTERVKSTCSFPSQNTTTLENP